MDTYKSKKGKEDKAHKRQFANPMYKAISFKLQRKMSMMSGNQVEKKESISAEKG